MWIHSAGICQSKSCLQTRPWHPTCPSSQGPTALIFDCCMCETSKKSCYFVCMCRADELWICKVMKPIFCLFHVQFAVHPNFDTIFLFRGPTCVKCSYLCDCCAFLYIFHFFSFFFTPLCKSPLAHLSFLMLRNNGFYFKRLLLFNCLSLKGCVEM